MIMSQIYQKPGLLRTKMKGLLQVHVNASSILEVEKHSFKFALHVSDNLLPSSFTHTNEPLVGVV